MKVDLTAAELNILLNWAQDAGTLTHSADRNLWDKLQHASLHFKDSPVPDIYDLLDDLALRVSDLEQDHDERRREKFNRDAERAWRGE